MRSVIYLRSPPRRESCATLYGRPPGTRAAFGAVAALFVLAVLALGAVAAWLALYWHFAAIETTLILLGINLVIAIVFCCSPRGHRQVSPSVKPCGFGSPRSRPRVEHIRLRPLSRWALVRDNGGSKTVPRNRVFDVGPASYGASVGKTLMLLRQPIDEFCAHHGVNQHILLQESTARRILNVLKNSEADNDEKPITSDFRSLEGMATGPTAGWQWRTGSGLPQVPDRPYPTVSARDM